MVITIKSILQLHAWLPSLWTGVRLRVTLLWYKPCYFSNTNYFVIMLSRYWFLSQQGHLQPHSKSKAWQVGSQLWNGPSNHEEIDNDKFLCLFYNRLLIIKIIPVRKKNIATNNVLRLWSNNKPFLWYALHRSLILLFTLCHGYQICCSHHKFLL